MARALKVYRTPIGFYDAYVAASSQKAALAAWGTAKDLFARQAAELVTDPALTAAPLARPGEVIRLTRGTAADHVKALGALPRVVPKPGRSVREAEPVTEPCEAAPPPARPQRPPKPSDETLVLAQAARDAAQTRGRERLAEIASRQKALAAERERVERELAHETKRREADVDRAKADHIAALAQWRKG